MLLTLGIALVGIAAYFVLPVSSLPQVDFPVVSVRASFTGASPEVMATSVATPLERNLSQIADVNQMTSQSSLGSTRITLQFGLDRAKQAAAARPAPPVAPIASVAGDSDISVTVVMIVRVARPG